jgi:hypothetical protein
MANGDFLKKALHAVKWDQNVADFLSRTELVGRFEECGRKLAIGAKQLETADKGNSALPFIRDMQASAQHVAAVTALALYRPAAYGMRCVLEACLYYSFFRVHPAELCTLAVDSEYYITKEDVMEFHKKHTRGFKERQERTGLQNRLNGCYKKVSALAHGQVPGGWLGHTALSQVKHQDKMLLSVADTFEEVERVVRLFLLCTVAQDLWTAFSLPARREFLKGLSGETKTAVGLSAL